TVALTGTTQRFINVELGKPGGNPRRVFNICHVIHILSALVLFILTEAVGIWYIHNWINIPAEKAGDAMFVFQVSTVAACLGIANVPFQGLLAAYERFRAQTIIDTVFILLRLLMVVALLYCSGNLLRIYAVMISGISVATFLSYHLYCYRRWPGVVGWEFVSSLAEYREALSFNNYNLLAASANVVKWQGGHFLLNRIFGTAINAAYGIGNLVGSYVEKFTGNLAMAAAPQIIQSHSGNDTERTRYLTNTVSRLNLLINLILFFTLEADLEFLLGLWLKNVPDGAVEFTKYTLILGLVGSTTVGINQTINASGKIKWFKIQYFAIYCAAFVAAILLYLYADVPVYTLLLVYIAGDALSRLVTVLLAGRILNYPVKEFVAQAFLRPAAVTAIMLGYTWLYRMVGLEGVWPHLAGCAVTFVTVAVLCWFIGLTPGERRNIGYILRGKKPVG
ncbi:MAG: hypothetical protein J5764_02960, partial [Bacteroidales bacterium]|nr:hypothetical protein [Bacteroidales bacterium]